MELCEIQKQREKVEKAYYEMKATKEVVENTSKEQVEKEARVNHRLGSGLLKPGLTYSHPYIYGISFFL